MIFPVAPFARATVAAALLFSFSALPILAAEDPAPLTAPPSAATAIKLASAPMAHVETRITDLHKKLMITADQEAMWTDIANVMRDNAQKMRERTEDRSGKLKTMTAIDDLKSYQMVSDEHADGLKRLIPVFQTLYDKMSPVQQKNADHVFGEHQRHAMKGA